MDSIQKKNLRESIDHTSLFFSIIKDYYNKLEEGALDESETDKMIDFMKNNHNSNKRILEMLGHSFDDTGKIRRLNERIHSLEKELGTNDKLTPQNISSYIDNLKRLKSEEMKTLYGIDTSMEVSISSYISIKFKFISACMPLKDRQLNYFRTEDEYNKSKEQKLILSEVAKKSNLDFSEEGDIYFTENNVSYIEDSIYSLFSEFGSLSDIKHNVSFFKSKVRKGNKEMYIFSDIEFTIIHSF